MARPIYIIGLLLLAVASTGCGTTKGRIATEQLVASDAVDHAVAAVDFRPLAGKTVYLDTSYLKTVKTVGFVNADYVISALRQQLVAADCRIQEKKEDAELIVEARVGTLGSDSNEVVYGIPASNSLSSAASLVPNAPIIPQIPEISVARKEAQYGAAKLALFAYNRETRRPFWQSGIARSRSTSSDLWFFGAGPFQRGTIVDGVQFAGSRIPLPSIGGDEEDSRAPQVAFDQPHLFLPPVVPLPVTEEDTANSDETSPVARVAEAVLLPGAAAKVTDVSGPPRPPTADDPADKPTEKPDEKPDDTASNGEPAANSQPPAPEPTAPATGPEPTASPDPPAPEPPASEPTPPAPAP